MMGFGTGMMGNWGYNAFGWLSMLLIWVLLIVGIIALIQYISSSSKDQTKSNTPLEMLKERYAKGEIDKNEFEDKKRDLI
ncbi:MAG TPA: SHOCT domain-containing protein [Patescibacteria group bacterium]|nr:SHOCT domain-containing protein [Patescibacteria group bacterium]